MSVGMPAQLYLDEFGSQVWSAFGECPYLVGSALSSKEWRDVDVRLILSDDVYENLGLGDPDRAQHNAKWVSLCLAYSALGKWMTNLPVDFQIQQRTRANEKYPGARSALGLVGLRYGDGDVVALLRQYVERDHTWRTKNDVETPMTAMEARGWELLK